MSEEATGAAAAVEVKAAVRLRTPERQQVRMTCGCADDLVSADHPVRTVWDLVRTLDLSAFHAPIKARAGTAGRDATDPALLVALWLYAAIRGIGSARELARRCAEDAPFQWLCGGVPVNHHLLSDFRVGHADALDALFTRVIASLVDKGLVKVERASQDGVRVRAAAGTSSFRRGKRLDELLDRARRHVEDLRRQLDDPAAAAAVGARRRAARERAARERVARLEAAAAQLPELERKREEAARRAGKGKRGDALRAREPRVSTTDPEARVMKMPNGGFNPAVNVQVMTDTASRAVIAVEVSSQASDASGLSEPLRRQAERRTGGKLGPHLVDGGDFRTDEIERTHAEGVELFVPPKPARGAARRGKEPEPKPGDTEAVAAWKRRMAGDEGKQIYKERAATSETVNADLRCYRGLTQMAVRGLKKAKCVALWCALAYNVMHFGRALLA